MESCLDLEQGVRYSVMLLQFLIFENFFIFKIIVSTECNIIPCIGVSDYFQDLIFKLSRL